jgi:hypothetical protein
MRIAACLSIVALAVVCSGQEAPRRGTGVRGPRLFQAAAATVPPVAVPGLDFAGVAKVESSVERKLKNLSTNDPIDLLGACSGVYLDGYGLVFTVPISLIAAPPSFGPFTGNYTPQKGEAVRQRKLKNLPIVVAAANEMLAQAAKTLPDLPPTEKIAVAIRFFYLDYEDTTGLPKEIVVSADSASAQAGHVQMESR